MRLLKRRVDKLAQQQQETREAAAREAAGWRIVWTSDDTRISNANGAALAVDVRVEELADGTILWRSSERLAENAGDTGRVLNAEGAVIGRVVRASDDVVEVEYDAPEADLPLAAKRGPAPQPKRQNAG